MKKRYNKELTIDRLARLPDSAIDTSDIPEMNADFWKTAQIVMPEDRGKSQITAKFDSDVIAWFKKQGRGYQARMNAVLRSFYEAHRDV